MAKEKKKTFHDLYEAAKSRPHPCQQFVAEVATLTCKSQYTVRKWLTGVQTPDELTQQTIAKHFGCKAAELFPTQSKAI